MGVLGDARDSDRDKWDDLELEYQTVQPNRWTFQSDIIRRWVEQRLQGRVLNTCAGKTKLTHDHEVIRNDIDEQRDADLHVDVCEIADHLAPESFDTIVYDPPFSQYQANRSYGGRTVGDTALAKRQFDALLRPGGRVIQFGFTTTCMPTVIERDDGTERSYHRKAVAIFNTLGQMHDYLATVDELEGESSAQPRWFK
jgi:hypothetical protein